MRGRIKLNVFILIITAATSLEKLGMIQQVNLLSKSSRGDRLEPPLLCETLYKIIIKTRYGTGGNNEENIYD